MIRKLIFVYLLFLMGCNAPYVVEKRKVKRIALVMGNQNHKDNMLENSINDAKGMAEVLQSIGFEVLLRFDLTLAKLNESLKLLESKVEPNNTMVFIYFAGHGNTLDKNRSEEYLLMTDEKEKTLVSIYKFYDFLNKVKSRYNIICIDACRDYRKQYVAHNTKSNKEKNFRGNFQTRSVRHEKAEKEKEFAFFDNNYSYEMPRSTIVSYAAMHHQVASDFSVHDQKHSSYTYALMKYIDDKAIPIEEVFRRVRVSQLQESHGTQSNLEETNLEKNIWLVPRKTGIAFMPPL